MNTQELFNLLDQHKNAALLFEYSPGQLVGANYHITEVKHVVIDSVDCGARADGWNETVIQLWESPEELGKTEYMTAFKALGILKKVGQMRAYDMNSVVRFEYGNSVFHTAQLFVNDYEIRGNQILLKLAVAPTDCKAKDICGVPEPAVAEASNSCSPGSGCC
ncbi:DUF6428 family protein [Gilvibacter sp.]|uniref:DUF6428 family protein n=1 Tax=Gilvibacter sp. TaxID=2729997 RepID=UPI003F4A69E6